MVKQVATRAIRPFVPVFAAAAAALLTMATGAAQQSLPLKVFVTFTVPQPMLVLTAEEHGQRITGTKNRMYATGEQLRREHGGKTKAWPPEVWDVFNAAEDAHAQAIARADYERDETRERLADSVADVVKASARSKVVTLVTAADQAELVVTVTGRRHVAKDASDMFAPNQFVRFQLSPGPLADRDRVLEAMRRHEWSGLTTKAIARPLNGAGFADLEAGSPYGMRQAGEWVIGMVEGFARARFGPAKK
jgi:hypothetical protein